MSTRIHLPKTAPIDCPNCGASHAGEVCGDEDGVYVEIETTGCAADDCTKRLCPECPQFVCESCGLRHCEDHKVVIGGCATCPVCVAAMVADGELELEEHAK